MVESVDERQAGRLAGVRLGRWHRSFAGNRFCAVAVGDVTLKLVELSTFGDVVEPMFLVESWDGQRLTQGERSGGPGSWSSERAALVRLVEHVYERSAVSSVAGRAAAGWLVATDWGRRFG